VIKWKTHNAKNSLNSRSPVNYIQRCFSKQMSLPVWKVGHSLTPMFGFWRRC